MNQILQEIESIYKFKGLTAIDKHISGTRYVLKIPNDIRTLDTLDLTKKKGNST